MASVGKNVFLSHNSKDKIFVRKLADALEKKGFRVWLDEKMIRPGDSIPSKVNEGLSIADYLILVLSPHSEKSNWVSWERDSAIMALLNDKREKPKIVPILYKDCEIPFLLNHIAYADFRDDFSDAFTHLLKSFGKFSRVKKNQHLTPQVAASQLRHHAAKLIGRKDALLRLDNAWVNSSLRIQVIIAWGGVGKTALVARWLADLSLPGKRNGARGWRNAEAVFDWTFYSQGTRQENSGELAASADRFFAEAFEFFSPNSNVPSDAIARGRELANLIIAKRTLIVLDGLEPLQFPPGPADNRGQLKDPSMLELLRTLAANGLGGLCLITTREPIPDLAPWLDSGSVDSWNLDELLPEHGAALLKNLGVRGTEDHRRSLSRKLGGHSLTLQLIHG